MDFRATPEQERLRATVREVGEREFAPRAAHGDRTEGYSRDDVERLVDLGLMGTAIPPQRIRLFGGSVVRTTHRSSERLG